MRKPRWFVPTLELLERLELPNVLANPASGLGPSALVALDGETGRPLAILGEGHGEQAGAGAARAQGAAPRHPR